MMLEHEIKIPAVKAASYRIKIGTEILGSLWPKIEADFGKYSKFVVTDENIVLSRHLQKLLDQRNVPAFIISPAGETSKNIDTLISIIEAMVMVYLGRVLRANARNPGVEAPHYEIIFSPSIY